VATSAPPSASPLVLLDGHSLAYRAFFALPSDLQTTTGQLTNVVYGFTTMLVKLFGDFSPDRIAVCFDLGRPAYRHDVYDGYKANRRTTPDDFSSQMPLVREVLAALRIPVVEVAGYEADDLIATLVKEAREEGLPVLVVTGDRDNLQLIDDEAGVRVMMTRRGITDTAVYDEAAVQERYGVPPGRYIDLAALRGDPSDNLPGVPGVGDKTATKLVQTYGTAEEVVAHASEQRGKLKENLLAHGEDVLRNKQLMRLRDDVPLPVVVRDCSRPRSRPARSTPDSRSTPGGWPRASWPPGWPGCPPAARSPWPPACAPAPARPSSPASASGPRRGPGRTVGRSGWTWRMPGPRTWRRWRGCLATPTGPSWRMTPSTCTWPCGRAGGSCGGW